MNTEHKKALMRNFLIELDKGLDAVDRFFSPDCLVHLPGTVSPTDRKGLKAFIGMLYTAFPDLRHSVIDQFAEHEKVANLVSAHCTRWGRFPEHCSNGKAVAISDIFIVRIMDE